MVKLAFELFVFSNMIHHTNMYMTAETRFIDWQMSAKVCAPSRLSVLVFTDHRDFVDRKKKISV